MTKRTKKACRKWRKLVSEQARSGLDVTRFCRERALCRPYFFAWKNRLRESAAAKFLEVQVAELAPNVAGDSRIEVRLLNGRSLVVGRGFDADHQRASLAAEASDMRCGFERLAERVKEVIGQDLLSGHLFVFRSRRGDRLKILVWERDGFLLWYQRLESGNVQAAKGGRTITLGRVAGERVGNDLGRHRCFETETRAALRTEHEKRQRNGQ